MDWGEQGLYKPRQIAGLRKQQFIAEAVSRRLNPIPAHARG
jgi:hypothetical protein